MVADETEDDKKSYEEVMQAMCTHIYPKEESKGPGKNSEGSDKEKRAKGSEKGSRGPEKAEKEKASRGGVKGPRVEPVFRNWRDAKVYPRHPTSTLHVCVRERVRERASVCERERVSK